MLIIYSKIEMGREESKHNTVLYTSAEFNDFIRCIKSGGLNSFYFSRFSEVICSESF